MYKLYELQYKLKEVLNLEEIKDFNDFKNYYKNKKESFNNTMIEDILIEKLNNEEVLDFNDFKEKDRDYLYNSGFVLVLNTILNLKEMDSFESFKEFFNCDYLELEEKVLESFCRNCLENIDFDFDSYGNLVIKKIIDKKILEDKFSIPIDWLEDLNLKTIVNINVYLDKGFKVIGINNDFYNECNEEDINFKLITEFRRYFYFDLMDLYQDIAKLQEKDSKIIDIFEKYIKEKFFSTEKEIKKYILKYLK